MAKGELRLGRNVQATVRMLLAAAVVGAGLFGTWLGAIDRAFSLNLLHLEGVNAGPLSGPTFIGALLGPALVGLILLLRQPRGAKVVFDDWGVTELDGEGVRAAIERGRLRHHLFTIGVTRRYDVRGAAAAVVTAAVLGQDDLPSTAGGATIGGQLALTDADGRRIDVCQGVQNLTLNKRLTTVDSLAPLIDYARGTPGAEVPQQVSSENFAALGYMVGLLGYAGAGLGLATIAIQPTENPAWFLPVPAGLILLLRALAFFRPVRRGRAPDSGARQVQLVAGEGARLQVKDGASTRWLDLAPLKHPDAALATRRGAGWIRTGPAGDLLGLETEAMRRARRSRLFADRLEAWGRVLLALLVIVPGAVKLKPYVARESSDEPGLKKVWLSPVPVSGVALSEPVALLNGDVPMVLDTRTGTTKPLPRGRCSLAKGAVSADARYAALTCDMEHFVEVWDLGDATPKLVAKLEQQDPFDALEFRPDGALLTCSGFGQLAVWSIPDGKQVLAKEAHDNVINLAVSRTGRVALMANDGGLYLWAGDDSDPVKVQRATISQPLAFSPDGKWLAVVSGEVELVDATTGASSGPRLGYRYGVKSIAFSPDSKRVAVAGESVTVFALEEVPRPLTEVHLQLRRGFGRKPFEAGPISFSGSGEVSVLAAWDGALFRVPVP